MSVGINGGFFSGGRGIAFHKFAGGNELTIEELALSTITQNEDDHGTV
jgi:hypothetical protein